MLTLAFGILLFLLFVVTGGILVCALRVPEETTQRQSFSLALPLIGAIFFTCICETLLLVSPVKYSVWLVVALLLLGAVWQRRKLGQLLKTTFWKPWPWLLLLVAGVVLAYPVLTRSGLVSIQSSNNDIIYYLSSIDWMKEHNIWATPQFSNALPYYGAADYMLKTTRIGTDVLGSMISSLFFLEPHQVYFSMGIALNLSAIAMIIFVLWDCCKLPQFYSLGMVLLLGCCFDWAQLQMMQYVPQIFGVGCMAGMTGFLLRQYQAKAKGDIFLTALFIIGTITVYAEFAFHILMIFIIIGIAMVLFSKQKRQERWSHAMDTIKAGFLSFILCPLGLYKAVKFNLMLVGNLATPENLDPYHGQMIPLSLMPKNLLGLALRSTDPSGMFGQILAVLIVLAVAIAIITVMMKRRNAIDWSLLGVLVFFAGYEFYFRASQFAYGEYKHIFSVLPVIWMIGFYFCVSAVLLLKKEWARKCGMFGIVSIAVILAAANIWSTVKIQPPHVYNYYDDSIFELREQAEQMPQGTVYNIVGGPNDLHRGVYALKDYPVVVTQESYFNFFKKPEGELKADYVLRQDVYSQDIYDVYENVPEAIWSNDLFIIVDRADEVKPLGIVMGDGFYAAERREGGTMRWTSSQKSEIVFCNNSGEDAALDFSFMALPAGEYKTILVKLEDGTVLANGDTEHQNMLSGYIAEVKAGERVKIIVETIEPLTPAGGGDGRQFGFNFRQLEAKLVPSK